MRPRSCAIPPRRTAIGVDQSRLKSRARHRCAQRGVYADHRAKTEVLTWVALVVTSPNVMVPKHRFETFRPVFPRKAYSILTAG